MTSMTRALCLFSKAVTVVLLSLSGFLSLPSRAPAAIETPVSNINILHTPKKTKVVHLTQAKVLVADYPLLRRDFPSLASLAEAEIDQWLVAKAAIMAIEQTQQTEVNTPIPAEQNTNSIVAYRPELYNRALVLKVSDGSLLDVKGVGSSIPRQVSHGNGLTTLADDLHEFLMEKKIDALLRTNGSRYRTVGTYAVLEAGFQVKNADGSLSPAGLVVRQAHTRNRLVLNGSLYNNFIDRAASLELETLFRRNGITSSGEGDWKTFVIGENRDVINLQGNDRGEIVDFGAYRFRTEFHRPAYWYPDSYSKEATPLLDPLAREFVQPDRDGLQEARQWGRPPPNSSIGRRIKSFLQGSKYSIRDLKTDLFELQILAALNSSALDERKASVLALWTKLLPHRPQISSLEVPLTKRANACRSVFAF